MLRMTPLKVKIKFVILDKANITRKTNKIANPSWNSNQIDIVFIGPPLKNTSLSSSRNGKKEIALTSNTIFDKLLLCSIKDKEATLTSKTSNPPIKTIK